MLNLTYKVNEFWFSLKRKYGSSHSLDKLLTKQGKARWLDIGCGGNFAPNFYYLDYYSDVEIPENCKERYFKINIIEITETDYEKLGKFDLIRLQHVFEHFTPEEGEIVLKNCAKLLNKGGYIVITVPDLKKFIHYYKRNSFKNLFTFYNWSLNRIEKNAPPSFFFSIFAHSLLHEQHKWCYDSEGLKYIIAKTGVYKNIRQLRLWNRLAANSFTHNRPWEDLCVIANI
ncbi:MAG TPA: methyltransferase domain-containing protein [Bacteroidales bacterium]|nr:methyltransferase domain-containing protein [Bacteroidales bacterium]